MMLLIKKIGGLGLFLIGGLIAAHGGSDGRGWEVPRARRGGDRRRAFGGKDYAP